MFVLPLLHASGGSFWSQNAEVIGQDGRWIVFGLMGGAAVDGPLLATLLRKRVRYDPIPKD